MASVQTHPNNGSLVVRWREGKKQKHKAFGKGEAARKAAEQFCATIAEKQEHQKQSLLSPIPLEVNYADELAVLYFQGDALKKEKAWRRDWKLMMNRHILPDLGQIPLAKLTQEFIVGLIMKKFPHASPTTHGNYLSYLKIMFNFGVERGYIEKNPLRFWKKQSQAQKDFAMDLAAIKKIRDVSPPHLALAIELIANTGVRPGPSELLALEWKNVLWDQSAIRVFAEKTQKWRTIPLKTEFLEKLRAQKELAKTDHIIEYNGKSVSSVHMGFRRACRKVGVGEEVVLYDIRHWFCSTLLSKGVPVKTVSLLMGHSSAKMTLDRYAHVIPGDSDKAIAHLPDLE